MINLLSMSFYRVLVGICLLLALSTSGQQTLTAVDAADGFLLNDALSHIRVPVKRDTLYLYAQSTREEVLELEIDRGDVPVVQTHQVLHYGMNLLSIPLRGLQADLQRGQIFHVHFQGRYFGQGNFELAGEPMPVTPLPRAAMQAEAIEVHCEQQESSSMEFLGKVQGGTPPYQLTWLISKGPYIKDFLKSASYIRRRVKKAE